MEDRGWPGAGCGFPEAGQNEAKTKPKSDAARAVYGRGGCVNRMVSRGKAEFLAGLRPPAVGQVKLQNEATVAGIAAQINSLQLFHKSAKYACVDST